MNKVALLGTITRDVEIKYTQSGTCIASFGVAYNEKRKDASGNYNDVSHFFDVTAFGKRAETVNQYFRKGSRILIDGSLDFQQWTDQSGQKRSKVSIKLNDFDFIDKRDNQSNNAQTNQGYQQPRQQPAQQYQAPHGQVPVYNEQVQNQQTQQPAQQSGYQQPQGR